MQQNDQSLKNAVLSIISDDYESLEHIVDSICRLPCPFEPKPNEAHIADALAGLLSEGLAAAYDLSPQPPHVRHAQFSLEHVGSLYFYITPAGREAARSLDELG